MDGHQLTATTFLTLYMDITALIKDLLTTDSKPLTVRGAAVAVGDQLLGTVLELKAEGTVLMDFGRFRAVSEIRFPVQIGEKLPLTVVNIKDRLELRLDTRFVQPRSEPANETVVRGVPNRFFHDVVSHVAQIRSADSSLSSNQKLPEPVIRALDLLVRQLTPLSMDEPVEEITNRIRMLVENSGLLFEKKLEKVVVQVEQKGELPTDPPLIDRPGIRSIIQHDLKPVLLLLREYFNDNPKIVQSHGETVVRQLAADVEHLLGNHEKQQDLMMEKRDPTEPFQMAVHTLPLKSEREGIKLNIFYPRHQKGDGKKYPQISILLEMDRLGAVRSDLVLIGRDLNITFFVTSKETEKAVSAHLGEVKSALTPAFDHVRLQIQVSEKKIDQLQSEQRQPPSGRLVDLRA